MVESVESVESVEAVHGGGMHWWNQWNQWNQWKQWKQCTVVESALHKASRQRRQDVVLVVIKDKQVFKQCIAGGAFGTDGKFSTRQE